MNRRISPGDISLPPGFAIEAFLTGLSTPIDMEFSSDGSLYIGDAGITSGSGRVLRYYNGRLETFADGFNVPLTGITPHNGMLYVSHRGFLTAVRSDGSKTNVLENLPSLGDHHNNKVVFGSDGMMYYGQGTATNSSVAGEDNSDWIKRFPSFHDLPAQPVTLTGANFVTRNILSPSAGYAYTGAYSAYGTPSSPGEAVQGSATPSGSIMRAKTDGSGLAALAWGLRNPFRVRFDRFGRLFVANHGMDVRGSRPVANAFDELHILTPGYWYGWPDYTGGMPVTLPQFKPANGPQPQFVLAQHPMTPPRPLASFAPHAAILGFDFNYGSVFPQSGDIYIAEFGSEAPETTGGEPAPYVGHRVSAVSVSSGNISTFAMNSSGVAASATNGGGFERPTDVKFGPDGSMYIADFGLEQGEDVHGFAPQTGLIWRVFRTR